MTLGARLRGPPKNRLDLARGPLPPASQHPLADTTNWFRATFGALAPSATNFPISGQREYGRYANKKSKKCRLPRSQGRSIVTGTPEMLPGPTG